MSHLQNRKQNKKHSKVKMAFTKRTDKVRSRLKKRNIVVPRVTTETIHVQTTRIRHTLQRPPLDAAVRLIENLI